MHLSQPSRTLGEPSPTASQGSVIQGSPQGLRVHGGSAGTAPAPGGLDTRRDEPGSSHVRPPLVCTCRLALDRNGQALVVVAHLWDCPSHGLDKRRRIADMCAVARPTAMWTFTMPQPHAVDREGQAVTPAGFEDCDWYTHVYVYEPDGTLRWRTLSNCPHCCRKVARMFDTLTKWVRRRYPRAQRLWAREDQKNGALHLHSAWAGVPFVARRSRAARRIRAHWVSLGGGHQVDFGKTDSHKNHQAMGWYIGKYLAKSHDRPMARGYRRWSRSRGFAPEVVMPRYEPDPDRIPGEIVFRGWVDPFSREVRPTRVLLPT